MARNGKVNSNRFRRPQRSIVKTAGMANTQFKIPVPIEANSAEVVEYPDSMKIWGTSGAGQGAVTIEAGRTYRGTVVCNDIDATELLTFVSLES